MKKFILGFTLFGLAGCQSAGFDHGYMNSRNLMRANKKVNTNSYSYGYMLGWTTAQQELR